MAQLAYYFMSTWYTFLLTFILPIQNKKVIIRLINRKLFCPNLSCNHKTFAERFDFIDFKSKKLNV